MWENRKSEATVHTQHVSQTISQSQETWSYLAQKPKCKSYSDCKSHETLKS